MQDVNSDKECSVKGCSKTQLLNPGLCFYPFPSELVTCRAWVEATNRANFIEEFEYSGASSFVKRFICSCHFRAHDFCIEGDFFSGLKENVAPYPGIDDIEESEVKHELSEEKVDLIKTLQILPTQKIDCSHDGPNPTFEDWCTTCESRKKHKSPIPNRKSNAVKVAQCRICQPEGQKRERLKPRRKTGNCTAGINLSWRDRKAHRAAMRRMSETEHQRLRRLKKEAQRASLRRMKESVEEKQIRRLKNCERSRIKRQRENEEQAAMRRYNDAVRAALRRQLETEDQKEDRRAKDLARAAARRQNETPEQREERLRKDRERVGKKREFLKVAKQMNSFWLPVPVETNLCEIPSESINLQDFSNHMAEYTQL